MKPRVCVLRTDGTNCDEETAYAFEKVGGEPRLVHVNELRSGEQSLRQYQALALPGGFSYGDDVASGKILAVELVSQLASEVQQFIDRDGLVIGICNGFQTLVRAGLLPFRHLGDMQVTLTINDSGRFECRWISMVAEQPSQCIFTHGITEPIELPVAHGEGKFFAHATDLELMEADGLVALRYAEYGKATMQYPANPNAREGVSRGRREGVHRRGRGRQHRPLPQHRSRLTRRKAQAHEGDPSWATFNSKNETLAPMPHKCLICLIFSESAGNTPRPRGPPAGRVGPIWQSEDDPQNPSQTLNLEGSRPRSPRPPKPR